MYEGCVLIQNSGPLLLEHVRRTDIGDNRISLSRPSPFQLICLIFLLFNCFHNSCRVSVLVSWARCLEEEGEGRGLEKDGRVGGMGEPWFRGTFQMPERMRDFPRGMWEEVRDPNGPGTWDSELAWLEWRMGVRQKESQAGRQEHVYHPRGGEVSGECPAWRNFEREDGIMPPAPAAPSGVRMSKGGELSPFRSCPPALCTPHPTPSCPSLWTAGGSRTCTLAVLEQSIRAGSPSAADHGGLRLLGDRAAVGSSQGWPRASARQEPEPGSWGVIASEPGTGRSRKAQGRCHVHRVNTGGSRAALGSRAWGKTLTAPFPAAGPRSPLQSPPLSRGMGRGERADPLGLLQKHLFQLELRPTLRAGLRARASLTVPTLLAALSGVFLGAAVLRHLLTRAPEGASSCARISSLV
ncbi:hypothetical protein P7K49_026023 [Saguinus oedipus]|uniref:Uncharacterized protein n=1 Tax=Saguinus oedipus TaxID=9490 RepID=A0ABQ9UIV2_SAGOE|nr:hypothetical protein P7K49_026023 [Saguinus oedipus]